MSVSLIGADGTNIATEANPVPVTGAKETIANVGWMANASKSDPGTAGVSRTRAVWATVNNKQLVAQTAIMWDDTFNATILNTSKYKFGSNTMTGAMAGGSLTLNNLGITTINAMCLLQTTQTFPFIGNSEMRVIFSGGYSSGNSPSTNNVTEFGLFTTATLTSIANPTDGAFFRFNAAAELRGVINFNGTETQTSVIPTPAPNVNHDWMIILSNEVVEFWVDRICYAFITLTTDAPAQGQPFMQASLPLTMRTYNAASAPGTACKILFSDVFITLVGPDANRTWNMAKAKLGHMAYQTQNGTAPASTALYSNSLASGAGAVMTNTTSVPGTGLGGQFSVQPTLAVGTDGILCSYLNPAPTVNITGRSLIISGISIQGVVSTTALTGGPVVYAYSLAFGHTALSLVTAETASFTSGGAKAPRRIALGLESYPVTAAVGTLGSTNGGVQFRFDNPIVLAPGEYVAVVAKNLGVVTSAGVITVLVTFDAVFE